MEKMENNTALLSEKDWSYLKRFYSLSPRESEVAKLVCLGLNNAEIAMRLKMAPGTAKTHTKNIYRRTRARNRISLLLMFVNAARTVQRE